MAMPVLRQLENNFCDAYEAKKQSFFLIARASSLLITFISSGCGIQGINI